jgi:hypothetical protein
VAADKEGVDNAGGLMCFGFGAGESERDSEERWEFE